MLGKKMLINNRGVKIHETDKCLGWLPVTQQNLVYHKGGLVYSFPKPPAPNNICV